MSKLISIVIASSALALIGGCAQKEPEADTAPPMQNNPNSRMTEMPQDAASNSESLDQGMNKESGTGIGN